MNRDITVFDYETTGFLPNGRPVEVAAIRINNKGDIVGKFYSIIKQNCYFSPEAVALHGITPAKSAGGMDEELATRLLLNFSRDSILLAHNIAFDSGVLTESVKRFGGAGFKHDVMCTLSINRCLEGNTMTKGYHELGNICKRNGIVLDKAHSADADCFATYELLLKLLPLIKLEEHINKIGYIKRFGRPKYCPEHIEFFPH